MPPLTLSFHGLPSSDALEADVRREAAGLFRIFPGIVRCRVLLEQPRRHQRTAGLHVRIELQVPGAHIVIDDQPPLADRALAIRDAFRVAQRRLEDDVERRFAPQ